MNLNRTRDKLEEAKFFLSYLTEAQDEAQLATPAPFRYFLSAFLGAAYSVEEYLEAEVVSMLREQARGVGEKAAGKGSGKKYDEWFAQWFTALPQKKQAIWDSFKRNRRSEIHVERTKTVTKEKAIPIPRSPLGLTYSFGSAAHRMMLQGVSTSIIQEHQLKIEGALHVMVKACDDYVVLLGGLITHFEQSAP